MMQTEIRSGDFTEDEVRRCILYTKKRWGVRLPENLRLILDKDSSGQVQVTYDPPIDRSVFRCTDYLVNNLDKLNFAKQSEQSEKCSHS